MKRKLIKLPMVFFGAVILLGLLVIPTKANAEELVIKTPVVSEEIKTYAQSRFVPLISGILHTEKSVSDASEYVLGKPFQFFSESELHEDITIFPILKNGEIKFTLYVTKVEGVLTSNVTRRMVDELESLKSEEMENVQLIEEQDNIYYESEGEVIQLYSSPIDRSLEKDSEMTIDKIDQIVDIESKKVEETDILETSAVYPRPLISPRGVYKDQIVNQIIWNISETQGRNSWCSAYAASAILNNKNDKRPTTVNDMVKWGNKGVNDGFGVSEVIAYGQSRNVAPYWVNRKLTKAEVTDQVNKSNGIWGYWRGAGQYINTVHAIDIIGTYNMFGYECYFIWNPWHEYTELVEITTPNIIYVVNGGSFAWTGSVTNW